VTHLRLAALLLLYLLLAGCVVPVRNSDKALANELAPRLHSQLASIQVGQTDRTVVRSVLGQPWLASEVWGVDVYRTKATVFAPGLLLTPNFPVPLPFWDSEYGYVLVVYDDRNIVESVADGILIDPARAGDRTTKASLGIVKLRLAAGSVSLTLKQGAVMLEVGADRLAHVVNHVGNPNACSIAAVMIARPLRHAVLLDGAKPRPMNIAVLRNLLAIVELHDNPEVFALDVAPGEHAFAVTETEEFEAAQAAFRCDAGGVVYASFDLAPPRDPATSAQQQVLLAIADSLSPELASRRLLLFVDNAWLVQH